MAKKVKKAVRKNGVIGKTELFLYLSPKTKRWLKAEAKRADTSVSKLTEHAVLSYKKFMRDKIASA